MFRPTLGFVLLCAAACAGAQHPVSSSGPSGTPSGRLADLSERYWTLNLESAPLDWIGEGGGGPLSATAIGDHRFDGQLDDLSSAGRARFLEAIAGIAREARQIPDEGLNPEDRLTKVLLLDLIDATQEIQVCDADRWTVDQLYGPQVNLPLTAMYYPLGSERGVDDLVARFGQAGRFLDQQIASLREGLAKGEVAPRGNVQLVIDELDELLKKDASHSDFLPPPEKLEQIGAGQRAAVLGRLSDALQRSVLPALRRYRDFLAREVLPKAREQPGLWALPRGEACYAAAIRMHTGLRLTPAELHQQGLTL